MSRDLVVALSGGIGGAKLALGLSRIMAADDLLVVANVGDDFEHLGLHISPASTIRSSDGAGGTRAGRSWRRFRRLAARTGSASAIAISRFISSARAGC